MVSLWPWKGEDNSPASFEKALSGLAAKISKSQAQLDALRQSGRRVTALWTLYSGFAYLLCFIILFLVVGWRNWTPLEYAGVSGGPVIGWIIRRLITSYYAYRIDIVAQRLEAQQKERAKTIGKLKAATKYDSTQELLEKYGGVVKPKPKTENSAPKKPRGSKTTQARASIGPPATANIQRQPPSQPPTPTIQQPPIQVQAQSPLHYVASLPSSPSGPIGQAEFAPNAFSAPPQYAHPNEVSADGHWYDRVLDLLLGEDETSPRNRVALICQNCRLINGQAPPGTKRLTDLGKWRCFGCGTMNGEEDEAATAVKAMKEKIADVLPDADQNSSVREPTSAIEEAKVLEEEISEGSRDDMEIVADSAEDSEELVEVQPRRGRSSRKKA